MNSSINAAQATALARERLRSRNLKYARSFVLGPPTTHEVGWSFSYTEGGERLVGGVLIFVTRDRRIHEIGFPHDVELWVRQVLNGGKFNPGDEPPTYEISDE